MNQPPRAPQHPVTHREHGVERPDPWWWMRDTSEPALVEHLVAERAFYDAAVRHLSPLVTQLETEMASRVPPEEKSPTWHRLRFSYYTLLPTGRDYPQLIREIRRNETRTATESAAVDGIDEGIRGYAGVLLDGTAEAEGADYYEFGVTLISPDERWLAWSSDATGDEVYVLRFRDLTTGTDLDEVVPRSYYGGAWSADSTSYFYTVHNQAYRPHQVWRHRLGTPVADDVLVIEEPDERFDLFLRGSRSGDAVVILSESRRTGEVWVIDAHDPASLPRSVGGRRDGVLYRAEHRRTGDGADLVIVTNDTAEQFALVTAPVPASGDQDHTAWQVVRPVDPRERVERVDAFAAGLVISFQTAGEHRLRLVEHGDLGGEGVVLRPEFTGGEVRIARTPDYEANSVTVCDQAHLRPAMWSRVPFPAPGGAASERIAVHRAEAPSFSAGDYVTERHSFTAPDGWEVPAVVLRHRRTPLDGTAPTLLYGYGAYEYSFPPEWDPTLPSLLDRGVVFVHTHIRGGGECGRRGYLDGSLRHKQHTFDDHLAVADGLVTAGLVDGTRLVTRGLSAGGLLQGVVFSQRPDRWAGVVAEVPFVDVVTTMFDAETPLTVNEWEEWGDPRIREEFDWMSAYDPIQHLPAAGGRSDLLVTGALHDPRVMVREPAKWVQALRETDPAWGPRCLFRAEAGAGSHQGPSGRFGHLAYEAEILAWVLDRMGLADAGTGGGLR